MTELLRIDMAANMTKREAFAMAAMQGLVVHCFAVDPREAARMAVLHADELLAALTPSEDSP